MPPRRWVVTVCALATALASTSCKSSVSTPLHRVGRLAKSCADAKYVVVVRTLERKVPIVREDQDLYVSGLQAGEVHVCNLETGKELGGFRLSAKNDDFIKSRGVAIGQAQAERDLGSNVHAAINAGLTKLAR